MSLPRNATAIDFAYAVHTDVGDHAVPARVDNKLVPLRTRAGIGPARGDHHRALGDAAPGMAGVGGHRQGAHRHPPVHSSTCSTRTRCSSAIACSTARWTRWAPAWTTSGRRRWTATWPTTSSSASRNCWPTSRWAIACPTRSRAQLAGRRLPDTRKRGGVPPPEKILITGDERGVISFGNCCHPVPGDDIIGYLSAGKGIVVHRVECPNLVEFRKSPRALHRHRLGPRGAWRLQGRAAHRGDQPPGVLATVAAAIAEADSNIEHVEYIERDLTAATLLFTIEVKNRKHLADVMRRVRRAGRGPRGVPAYPAGAARRGVSHVARSHRSATPRPPCPATSSRPNTRPPPSARTRRPCAPATRVYLSGQIPLDPASGELVHGDIAVAGAARVRQPQGRLRGRRRQPRRHRARGHLHDRPGAFRRRQRGDGGLFQAAVPGASTTRLPPCPRARRSRSMPSWCSTEPVTRGRRRVAPGCRSPALAAGRARQSVADAARRRSARSPASWPRAALRRRLQDLWFHLPLRYEDRTRITPIRDLRPAQPAQVEGVVEAVERGFRYRPSCGSPSATIRASTLLLRFFHFRKAQAEQFAPRHAPALLRRRAPGQHGPEMVHPQYQRCSRTTPLDERLTRSIRRPRAWAGEPAAADRAGAGPPADEADAGADSRGIARALGLPSLARGPADRAPAAARRRPRRPARAGRHPAQQRLAFEELLTQHLSLRRQRIALQRAWRACRCRPPGELRGAPARAPAVRADRRAAARPATKSPPTWRAPSRCCAWCRAMSAAARPWSPRWPRWRGRGGWQAALMAPTELLAEQHLANLRAWLEPLGVRVAWLAGKVTGRRAQRRLRRSPAAARRSWSAPMR